MDYIITFMEQYGYWALFITMALENANVPIPSEIVLGFAGYLIARGVFDTTTTIIVGTLAGILGSVLSYWMGEYGGRPLLLKYGKYIFFNEHKFELAEKLFNKYRLRKDECEVIKSLTSIELLETETWKE